MTSSAWASSVGGAVGVFLPRQPPRPRNGVAAKPGRLNRGSARGTAAIWLMNGTNAVSNEPFGENRLDRSAHEEG